MRIVLFLAALSSICLASSATQTDWSGGGGVPGPVTAWGNAFNTSASVSWLAIPGKISLSSTPAAPVTHSIAQSFDYAISVYAADVDGDGDMDVLGAANSADAITWWENSDTAPGVYWFEHTVDGDFDGARSVYSSDVDGDGDMDVLGAAFTADDITWWENANGSGTSWVTHTVDGGFDFAFSVHAADVDSDGDMDVLGAASYADDITWWEVSEFLDYGQLTSSILDSGGASDWGQVTWTGFEPANTDLTVELRTGNSPGAMGSWIAISSSGDEIPSGFDGMRYLQYRILMTSDDGSASPNLEDITVDWTGYVGTEGDMAGIPAYRLFGACPNPAHGFVQIGYSVPEATGVELTVYDLAGRSVDAAGICSAEGQHTYALDGLAAGVYVVRMRAGEFEATERFVVVE